MAAGVGDEDNPSSTIKNMSTAVQRLERTEECITGLSVVLLRARCARNHRFIVCIDPSVCLCCDLSTPLFCLLNCTGSVSRKSHVAQIHKYVLSIPVQPDVKTSL